MPINISDILTIKYPNADFTKDIILQDDGNGTYIKEWNISDPKPSSTDLAVWETEVDLHFRQKQAVLKRNYPRIQDQLDMIYHDQMNGTNVWLNTISNIKTKNPKPEI